MHLFEFAFGAQGDVRGGLGLGIGEVVLGAWQFRKPLGDQIDELGVRQVARGGDNHAIRRVTFFKP